MGDVLEEYREKRNLSDTPEPEGDQEPSSSEGPPRFVIQEHEASSHHYDFRLEVDGVLKSWAVPKGPSTDPSEKRLAVETEDHPLAYGDFEGVIPEGYGEGAVLLWDAGTYRNLKEDDDGDPVPLSAQIEDGHATVWLEGEKLTGGYALTRMGDDGEEWLLVKMDDEEADRRRKPTSTEPGSVKTGRTIDEVEEEGPELERDDEEGGS